MFQVARVINLDIGLVGWKNMSLSMFSTNSAVALWILIHPKTCLFLHPYLVQTAVTLDMMPVVQTAVTLWAISKFQLSRQIIYLSEINKKFNANSAIKPELR